MPPIIRKQTTLIKFLPGIRINPLISHKTPSKRTSKHLPYTLELTPYRSIFIKETHCLRCRKRLVKNGSNRRIVYLDKWRGKRVYHILRKRCPRCGEVHPDYSKLAPKYANYHRNYRARARQHYMEGLMPPQIQRVFQIDFGITISKSTLVRWINEIAEPLRTTLRDTPVPSSGYWGYDEIHMKIAGKKRYTIDTVDLTTRFVPVARISQHMGRNRGREVLSEGRKHATLKLKGIVKDCSANLGGLFKTRSFKRMRLQNCITHVKWIISRHLRAYIGIPSGSPKPLPKEWNWLRKRFYSVIDAKNETDIYIKLEILRYTINGLDKKRIKRLIKAFRQLEKWIPKLIAHQRDSFLSRTNNLLESFHKKYTYYPSFKKHMMTERGAQRILDYRVFKNNFERFPHYIRYYELKRTRWRASLPEMKGDRIYCGQGNHYGSMIRKLYMWFSKYQELWTENFAII